MPGSSDLDRLVARLLTIGTYGSVTLLVAGVAAMLVSGASPLDEAPRFDAARVVDALIALRPEGFLSLGLLVVVATPAARVLASLVGYVRQGDRPMTFVAAGILAVIALGVVLAGSAA
jgi:uncharacterized membrane protein